MKEQVLSIEQMQELIALGIDASKAVFAWNKYPYTEEYIIGPIINKDSIPTFTLQDILEIVRKQTFTEGGLTLTEGYENKWICCFTYQTHYDGDYTDYEQFGDTSIEAAFNMLKWCKQNNYI